MAKPTASALLSYLKNPRNSRAREYLLTTRLIHDLTTAAAARDYSLQVYIPPVDSDGFDVILDDRDVLVPIQLKSVLRNGKAAKWRIHRKLLRPLPADVEVFGFEPSPTGAGRAGGVILIRADQAASGVAARYEYTDIHVITALLMGVLPVRASTTAALQALRKDLEAKPSGQVRIPAGAFLKARSPEHLLALAGLHSRFNSQWRLPLRQLAEHHYVTTQLSIPDEDLRKTIRDTLASLIVAH